MSGIGDSGTVGIVVRSEPVSARYDSDMTTTDRAGQAGLHEQWLLEITGIPTAAGKEQRVIRWVERWVAERPHLELRRDRSGNLFLRRREASARDPIFITAHLDHPAFVIRQVHSGTELECCFLGGVHDPYFVGARVEAIDGSERFWSGVITTLDSTTKPFKTVRIKLDRHASSLKPGDIARWEFPDPVIRDGLIFTDACDDLAALAAAMAALDTLSVTPGAEHVGVLLTRAEEIGFIGAIAAARSDSIPNRSRLICLENSRSFAESPIGAGPILRVGDKASVFSPSLTNRIGQILGEYQKSDPTFRFQRKLMPGGTCEATAFSCYGWESTCLCLPLGNYHNMVDIDGVLAGSAGPKVGPEHISIDDYHGLIRMLEVCCTRLDSAEVPPLKDRMEELFASHSGILDAAEA